MVNKLDNVVIYIWKKKKKGQKHKLIILSSSDTGILINILIISLRLRILLHKRIKLKGSH